MMSMKDLKLTVAIAAAVFVLGLVVGRYALPVSKGNALTQARARLGDDRSKISKPVAGNSQPAATVAAESANSSARGDDIFAKLKELLATPGTRRLYNEFANVAGLIGPDNVRAVLAFAVSLSQRDQRAALSMLIIGRWAEFDPQAPIATAQNIRAGPARN